MLVFFLLSLPPPTPASSLYPDEMSRAFLSPSATSARTLDYCKLKKDGHLLIVILNRPERLNALHLQAHMELAQVFDDFEADPNLWCAIVTGEGRAFSAGNDLRVTAGDASDKKKVDPQMAKAVMNRAGFCGLTRRFDMQKPVIAAVNGVAMGGGFEIALACDLIVASEKAIFALPEPKVGLFAAAGVALVLAGLDELQLGERGLTGRLIPGVVGQPCPQTAWGELAQVRQVLHHARPVVGKFAYACIHSAKARSKQVRKLSGIRPAVQYFCGGRLRSRALGTLDSMCAAGRPSRTWSAGRVGCRGSRSCGRKAASWAF